MDPLATGTLLALASALAFGVTTPLVQELVVRSGAGAFTTAAALYLGAALFGQLARRRRGAGVPRALLGRVLVVALAGAVLAPASLAWGLRRTSGTSASLMLNLEAVFTLGLAWLVHREHVGRRVALAAALLLAAGALLVLDRAVIGGAATALGLVAVAIAAFSWALDNTLAKPLAAIDPAEVVRAKAALGAVLSLAIAVAAGEPRPAALPVVGLVAVGATGYGLSLALYLRAQRTIGAGRTASVFATGPFWGALVAMALGEPATARVALAAAAMIGGLVLHLTERHAHPHVHPATEHEHAHRHDDGHHDHVHDPMPEGEHTHRHRHARIEHAHAHGPDLEHEHEH